jgi:phage-related protein
MKPLVFIGSSKVDLTALPADVKLVFGHALWLAQMGTKFHRSKVLKGFGGAGVLEVVEDFDGNTYRAVYTVKFAAAIYVLHVFQKKSHRGKETPGPDMALIKSRLETARRDSEESE